VGIIIIDIIVYITCLQGVALMRILHTSDWHLGRNLEQFSRLNEQREFVDWLCNKVEELEIELVLIAGDIYDTYNPPAAAEEIFYDAVDRLSGKGKRAVIVISGNHDNPERLCAASPLAYKNGIILLGYPSSDASEYTPKAGSTEAFVSSSVRLADSGPGWLELKISGCPHNAVIITLPYPSEARLEELLSKEADENLLQKAYSDKIGNIFKSLSVKFRDDTVNLAVAHIFVLGGSTSDSERTLQVGGAMTVSPDVLPEKADYVALGHLHRPQQIKNAPCPAYYSGSPLAYSFSEAEYSKAVYVIDVVPGKPAEIAPVYIDCGKPLRRWVATEGIGQAIKWCEEGREPNALIDLEILTDRAFTAEEQRTLRSLHAGILNIRPRFKAQETEEYVFENREGRKVDELFRDFYKARMGVDIPEELMNAFLEIVNDEDEVEFDENGMEV